MNCVDWCGVECINGQDCPSLNTTELHCEDCYYNICGSCNECYFYDTCKKGDKKFEQR